MITEEQDLYTFNLLNNIRAEKREKLGRGNNGILDIVRLNTSYHFYCSHFESECLALIIFIASQQVYLLYS